MICRFGFATARPHASTTEQPTVGRTRLNSRRSQWSVVLDSTQGAANGRSYSTQRKVQQMVGRTRLNRRSSQWSVVLDSTQGAAVQLKKASMNMHLIAVHRLAELVAACGEMTSTGLAPRLISSFLQSWSMTPEELN